MEGQDLKAARKRRGWSQKEAARRLDASQPYLSLLEAGKRVLTPWLARRAARVFGLPPTALPLSTTNFTEGAPSDQVLAEHLANLGYPGFAYLRSRRLKKNPTDVLLAALAKEDLEPRLTEALPWLLLRYEDLDSEYLVKGARLQNVQNRLGFVVNLARRVAEATAGYGNCVPRLWQLEQELERSRLAVEDTLCRASLPEAKRRWLEANRPPEAAHWHLLTDWRPETLRYVA